MRKLVMRQPSQGFLKQQAAKQFLVTSYKPEASTGADLKIRLTPRTRRALNGRGSFFHWTPWSNAVAVEGSLEPIDTMLQMLDPPERSMTIAPDFPFPFPVPVEIQHDSTSLLSILLFGTCPEHVTPCRTYHGRSPDHLHLTQNHTEAQRRTERGENNKARIFLV